MTHAVQSKSRLLLKNSHRINIHTRGGSINGIRGATAQRPARWLSPNETPAMSRSCSIDGAAVA